jgi:tetratricopeptide (TPR) repeat protein
LGVAYVDNSLYDEAVDAFEHAFALNPKDSNAAVGKAQAIDSAINAHMDKANNFLLNNQYTAAISEWQKVLIYQPDNQQTKDFIADAKKKIDSEVEKHYQTGLLFAKNKEAIKALNEWNAALEMDPQNEKVKSAIKQTKTATSEQISALLQEGKQLEAEKDYPGAMAKYQQAKIINPASSSVQARIAKLKAIQMADLKKSMTLANEKSIKGDYKSALQAYESAYRVDPANVEVKEALFETKRKIREKVESLLEDGTSLIASGNKTGAKAKFDRVLSLDPNNEKANDSIQQLTGQQAVEKVDADKVKALYYEGVNNYINGNINEAVQKWNECLKLDPSNVNAKNNINKAEAKLKSIEQLNHN